MAVDVRIPGDIGTTERESGKQKTRPYKRSTVPSARLAGTSVTASIPTARQRAKRASIEAQTKSPKKRTRKSATVNSITVLGTFDGTYPNETMYLVDVKVRGCGTVRQSVNGREFRNLWFETYGEHYNG